MRNEENFRRLEALRSATLIVTGAEAEYYLYGEDAHEPFHRWPKDGDINLIYDKNGKLDHVVTFEEDE